MPIDQNDFNKLMSAIDNNKNTNVLTILKALRSDEERLNLIGSIMNTGDTLFQMMIKQSKTDVLIDMLDSLSDEKSKEVVISVVNQSNQNALYLAFKSGNPKLIQAIIDKLPAESTLKVTLKYISNDLYNDILNNNIAKVLEILTSLPSDELRLAVISGNYLKGGTDNTITRAAYDGHAELLQAMLNSLSDEKFKQLAVISVDPNRNYDGLHWAISKSHIQAAQVILDNMPNDERASVFQPTLMNMLKSRFKEAYERDDILKIISILTFLPSDELRLELINDNSLQYQDTPFILAAYDGKTELLNAMLNSLSDEKSKQSAISAVNIRNQNALYQAISKDHIQAAQVIFDNMPNDKRTSVFQSALMNTLKSRFKEACGRNDISKITLILKFLPSDKLRLELINDNSLRYQDTPFILAAYDGKTELLNAMLNSLSDEKSKQSAISAVNRSNQNALYWAKHQGHIQAAQILLDNTLDSTQIEYILQLDNKIILDKVDISKKIISVIETKYDQQDDIKKLADQLREQIKKSISSARDSNKEKIKNLTQDAQSVHHAGNIDTATKNAHTMLKGIYNKPQTDAESRQILAEILKKIDELKGQSKNNGYNGPSIQALNSAQNGIERMLSPYVSDNTRQLIALAWTAASDKSKLIDPDSLGIAPEILSANLQETILIQMHEAQNTYGLDKPSCIPGTENRVMTALSQYYPNIDYSYGIKKETEFQDINSIQAKYIIEGKLFAEINKQPLEERIDMFKRYKRGVEINAQDPIWKNAFYDAEIIVWQENINYRPALLELMAFHEETSITDPTRCLQPELDLQKELTAFIRAKYANQPPMPDDIEEILSEFIKFRNGLASPAKLISDDIINMAFKFIDTDKLVESHAKIHSEHMKSLIEGMKYAELKAIENNDNLLQEKWAAYNTKLNLTERKPDIEKLKNLANDRLNTLHAELINSLRQDIEKIAGDFKNTPITEATKMAVKISSTIQENYADLLPDSDKRQETITSIMIQPCVEYLRTCNTPSLWQNFLRILGIGKELETPKTSFAEKIATSFVSRELERNKNNNANNTLQR